MREQINNYQQKVTRDVEFATAKSASEVVLQAQQKVPVDTGKLKQSIRYFKDKGGKLVYWITADEIYAPYIEFGTGNFVKVPSGFEKMAMSFYVNGEGKTKPQPFLIPSWIVESSVYKEKIKEIIRKHKL